MKFWSIWMAAALVLAGCDPRQVDSSEQVDAFLSQGRLSAICVALNNHNDDKLREYATRKLVPNLADPVASDCICKGVYRPQYNEIDESVGRGIEGSGSDALAACVAPALDNPSFDEEKRITTISVLAGMNAPRAYKILGGLLEKDESAKIREMAAKGLIRARDDYQALLLEKLGNDSAPEVRAAIAEGMERVKDEVVVTALLKALHEDKDGGVRAAALKSVVKLRLDETDKMVCDAMMNDLDERVRDQAVRSFRGSKRSVAIQCLKNRLYAKEESTKVRASTLTALGRSPSDEAALVLCHAIGPFLRMYVVDGIAERLPAVNIIETQNNRDFERSYECVEKAIRQGGYSCYARNHLGQWMNELGGKAATPWCPGMVKE